MVAVVPAAQPCRCREVLLVLAPHADQAVVPGGEHVRAQTGRDQAVGSGGDGGGGGHERSFLRVRWCAGLESRWCPRSITAYLRRGDEARSIVSRASKSGARPRARAAASSATSRDGATSTARAPRSRA